MIITELTPDIKTGDTLSEDLARWIASEDHEEAEVVFSEIDYDTLYKDSASCEVVFQYGDKLWSFVYGSYQSHYGSGEDTYHDCDITEVEYYEEEVITIKKGYRPV